VTKQVDLAGWVNSDQNRGRKQFRCAVDIVLTGISSSPRLSHLMSMKGGMLLAIGYQSSRHTIDIDFSTNLPRSELNVSELINELDEKIRQASDESEHNLACLVQSHKLNPQREDASWPTLIIKAGYADRANRRSMAKLQNKNASTYVQIDISINETVVEVELMDLGEDRKLLAYTLSDLVAEKLRSILQQKKRNRHRRQDIFDIFQLIELYREELFGEEFKRQTKESLTKKARARDIEPTHDSFTDPEIKNRAQIDYEKVAEEINGELPDFEEAFARVKRYYESLPWTPA
jgi:uncharacterized protein with HEPN domain